jgi:hypothetical protein
LTENLHQRWYDSVPELGKYIQKLGRKRNEDRNRLLVGMKNIIIKTNRKLIDDHVLEFQLNRRWYDHDPFAWMIMNALKYAEEPLLIKIRDYLKEHLSPSKK